MKFHNIKMVGPFNNEQLASLPTFSASRDQSRMVWLNDGSLWYGTQTQWIQIMAGGSVHNDLGGRSDNDCHPISAITGLEDALQNAGMSWEVRAGNFTAVKHTGYFADTSAGPITVTLPVSASIGDPIYFVDSVGAFDETNKLIIDNNGHNIMGFQDTLEITEKYMSVYLVYADTAKGWVIADGKGCDEDISGGEISADKTVYLAPSASSQSPTGIAVGSDTTGDGSLIAPFFSINRAMEYLENFNIKVGVSVTIHGLSGIYNYNETHAVQVKHKDAKYINVKFDMLETGNYHETYVTTDPVVQDTSNSDHDLITFVVNDMGTGFYQLQAGDYIAILPDRTNLANHLYAVWGGYYLIDSVDVPNNKVTIVFKRYQSGGSYNASHSYRLPDTIPGGVSIQVVKYSTHIYTTISDVSTLYKTSFFVSDYGFGGFQINASDTEYYTTHPDAQRYNFVSIYDGVINDIIFHLNGYDNGVNFYNLECHCTDNSTELFYSSIATSCGVGLYVTDTQINPINGYIANNSNYGLTEYNSSINIDSQNNIVCITNMYYHGIAVSNSAIYNGSYNYTEDTTNIFYCLTGIILFDGSVRGCGLNVGYCYSGFNIYSTSILYFFIGSTPANNAKIYNNYYGIIGNGFLRLNFVDIYNNTNGIAFYGGNIYSENSVYSNIYNNTNIGLYTSETNVNINSLNVYNNGSQGIYMSDHSNGSFKNINVHDNGGVGIECRYDTSLNAQDNIKSNNNTGNGINIYYNSNIFIQLSECKSNGSLGMHSQYNSKILIYGNCDITSNTSGDLTVSHNSFALIEGSGNTITNKTPTPNSTPSYSNNTQGSYILQ